MTQDETIDSRVARIEQHMSVLQGDVSVLKGDVAVLRNDMTELRVDINVLKLTTASKVDLAQARTSIIIWVVSTVFLAQLLPALLRGFS